MKPGPRPLPAHIHRIRGNISKKPIGELLAEVQPDVVIPGCPPFLLKEAKKEWKRITPELEVLGLIAVIDRAALALYCQAWAWWVYHEQRLQAAMRAAEEGAAKAAAEGREWTGGDGFMIPTPNGSFTYSPHWVGKNKAQEQVDKFLQSFGMSPSSRSRVTGSSEYPWLPGLAPDDQKPSAPEKPAASVSRLSDFARPKAS